MKVLHIVSAYPRFQGDIITPWLIETMRRLKEKEVEIVILAPSYRGLATHTIDGIRVERFRYFFKRWENLTHEETAPDRVNRSLFYKLLVPFYLLFGVLKTVAICRRESFDVIHVHWPIPHAIFGYFGKRASQARLVLTFYGVELRWVKQKYPFLKNVLNWLIGKADLITAISTHTRNEILPLTDRPVTIIPFGAGLDIKEKPAAPSTPPEILFVGRLVERKGVRFLIEAFDILSRKTDVKLFIVGEGPEKGRLLKQAQVLNLENRIVFTGGIPEGELTRRYQNCSVLVLPAVTDSKGDTEGLGVVLIEALTYKRPVVASRVGGIVDIVEDGKTGLLVPEKDALALSQALERLLTNKKLSQQLAAEGYNFVRNKFSWDKIISQLLQVYQS
jgi:glycosyltransferase involved in cell wall biosynthesis